MDRTAEKLRSKHVRTLELLQKTLDENAEMKNKLAGVDKPGPSSFQLSLGQGASLATRTLELENEIERLKIRHAIALKDAEAAAAAKQKELELLVDQHIQDKRFNTTSNTAVGAEIRRRVDEMEAHFDIERGEFRATIEVLEGQLQAMRERESMHNALVDAKQRADDNVSKSMEAKRQAEVECVRLADMVEKMKKNEWVFLNQVETLKAQKLVFESEHSSLYQALEARDREVERLKMDLMDHRRTAEATEVAMQSDLRKARDQVEKLTKQRDTRSTEKDKHGGMRDAIDEALRPSISRSNQLARENQLLQDEIAMLRGELKQALSSKSGFATHVDLKKENHMLRQQVEEMQALQKKFLGTAKKNNVVLSLGNQRG
ncbi:Aste57867_20887 [Aphanomyces stellatus]|uniref:Aste57867_20887 protein n=1 Tax=Aphanomyces stellatus TaxID=120398 RepID=A0A485LG38_9STRA|nr:hypothetical protein As57867_020819 [Aphanomyces stellatus]VFT97564.1 Aste57867_20887 [Aphanomyces stellatus]